MTSFGHLVRSVEGLPPELKTIFDGDIFGNAWLRPDAVKPGASSLRRIYLIVIIDFVLYGAGRAQSPVLSSAATAVSGGGSSRTINSSIATRNVEMRRTLADQSAKRA